MLKGAQSAQNLTDAASALKQAGTLRGSVSGTSQCENHGDGSTVLPLGSFNTLGTTPLTHAGPLWIYL